MSLETQANRGIKADALLKNDLFNEAFDMTRLAILNGIESLPTENSDEAEKLRLMLKLLRVVRAKIEQAARDGKVAAFRLEEQRNQLSPAEWSGR